jgi:hypothetical protein
MIGGQVWIMQAGLAILSLPIRHIFQWLIQDAMVLAYFDMQIVCRGESGYFQPRMSKGLMMEGKGMD